MKTLLTFLAAFVLLSNAAQAQIINIPDANFKNALVGTMCIDTDNDGINDADVDINNDGEVDVAEAILVENLNIQSRDIATIDGIEYFNNLEYLECSGNLLTTLNINNLVNLKFLSCYFNQITTLNLQSLINLEQLYCNSNSISALEISNCIKIKQIDCSDNNLTVFNITDLIALEYLNCINNRIIILDTEHAVALQTLYCSNNLITVLNLNNAVELLELGCSTNRIISLDVSNAIHLNSLYCAYNPLQYLYIKNGSTENPLNFYGHYSLKYICADEGDMLNYTQSSLVPYNCVTNSYCSFTPGGIFYTLQGKNKVDFNANGCDINDVVVTNMRYEITNNIVSDNFIANSSGHYDISVQEGTHTLKPILPHPNYYTISPDSIQVTFPNTVNDTLTQDFCITPNGAHHDLEITVIPIVAARPGFDAVYQLVYKNNGTVIENDSITLRFNDEILDFVSASIVPNAQRTNYLVWEYSNLQPFETRTITFTLNVNSPMETPPVAINDVLLIQAIIYPFATDETPSNNRSNLRQIVVGSLDPNDKTCLEGNQILPTQIGDYLHYLIRFENTGTYAAENIVVKDVIDTTKFDIKTLEMVTASHDCRARILKQNQVEFIFENINLPFTAPDKHGFVAFKIKTKPTLLLGNIIQNKADIFFDYNFPIRTNTTTTQIVDFVANQTNETAKIQYLQIQPNPANIATLVVWDNPNHQKSEITITDALGKIVLETQTNTDTYTLNCATWATGIYTITIKTKNKLSVGRLMR